MKHYTNEDVLHGNEISAISVNFNELSDCPLWHHKKGISQTVSGYGARLTTRYKIHFEGKLRRIYATCYSNNASTWFTYEGKKIHVA